MGYPIDYEQMDRPVITEGVCPLCSGGGMIRNKNGTLSLCVCYFNKSLRHLELIPRLKEPTKLSKALQQKGVWIISVPEYPMGRICLYDIHLRRALIDTLWSGVSSFTWKEFSPNELINICWNRRDGRNQMLIRPDLLSIKMMSWSLSDSAYDTVCEIISERTEANKITLIASPNVTKDIRFTNKQFDEWFQKMVSGKHGISLSWGNKVPETYDDQPHPAPVTSNMPLTIVVREESISKEERVAEGLKMLLHPVAENTPVLINNISSDDDMDES
jgi:hypothetical protein